MTTRTEVLGLCMSGGGEVFVGRRLKVIVTQNSADFWRGKALKLPNCEVGEGYTPDAGLAMHRASGSRQNRCVCAEDTMNSISLQV